METNKKIIGGTVIVLVVGALAYWFNSNNVPQEVVTNVKETNTLPDTSTKIKDGEYVADSQYMTPAGQESVGIKMTLTSGKITNLIVEKRAKDKTSDKFQTRFISGIQSIALNQSIETLSVGVVSGASLTSGAFNQALAKVKAQAMQ
jgi:uncharacterized protein with FMN-binding domain